MDNKHIIRQELLVEGDAGRLFEVTDSFTGILHSVSDISGIPIFKVEDTGNSTFSGPVFGTTPTLDFHLATKGYVDANSGGIADAPSDGSTYGRNNASWVAISGGDAILAATQSFTGVNTFTQGLIVSTTQTVRSSSNNIEIYNGTNANMNFTAGHATAGLQVFSFFTGAVKQLEIAGDTGIDMTSAVAVSVPTPTTTAHAATKGYVDGFITEVAAGTGLTGGATSGVATLNVDLGTGATQAAFGNHTHTNYITSNASDSATGIYTFTNATASTGLGTGALRISGGIDVALNSYFGGQVYMANGKFIYIKDNAAATTRLIGMDATNNIYIGHVDAVAAGNLILRTGAADRMTITNAGVTTFTGNVNAPGFYETSDRRLKEKVLPLDDVFYQYELIGKPGLRYGVIAQEIEKIYPTVVQSNEDGYLSVDYTSVLVQELIKLKARVKELEDGKK